jgi:hypothetical protein
MYLDVMILEDGKAVRGGRLYSDGRFVGEEAFRDLLSSIIDLIDPADAAEPRSLFREISRRLSSGYIYCWIGEE